jgi:hypothetical protein
VIMQDNPKRMRWRGVPFSSTSILDSWLASVGVAFGGQEDGKQTRGRNLKSGVSVENVNYYGLHAGDSA